jgi:hypothetical protein
MVDRYYKILGILPGAGLTEIKKAYREKAKILHPDRNKNVDAHKQFILLNEAYEYLTNYLSGKVSAHSTHAYAEWESRQRTEAREAARRYARMRYEEFTKTDFYKKSKAADVIIDHFYLATSVLLIIGSPVIGFIAYGFTGLIVGIFFVLLSTSYWAGIFTDKMKVDTQLLWDSFKIISRTNSFRYALILPLNLFFFLHFTLNTAFPTITLLLILAQLILITYLLSKIFPQFLKKYSRTFWLTCIIPAGFNLFFLLNFVFSSSPRSETYSFIQKEEWSHGRKDKTSYIVLENNIYEDYHWFRMFFNYHKLQYADSITYTFEDGLFGIRVLKSYTFK